MNSIYVLVFLIFNTSSPTHKPIITEQPYSSEQKCNDAKPEFLDGFKKTLDDKIKENDGKVAAGASYSIACVEMPLTALDDKKDKSSKDQSVDDAWKDEDHL